jgi:hypothetical protein
MALARDYDSDVTFVLVKEVCGNTARKGTCSLEKFAFCFWFQIWQHS